MANRRDLIGGLAAIAIGAGYLSMALEIRHSALDDAVGPAGLPKVLAFLMIGLGAILCVKAALAGGPARPAGPVSDEAATAEATGIRFSGIARAGGLLAIAAAYLLVVHPLGYLPSIFMLLVAASLYGGAALTWRVFAIGAGGAVFYWLLFVQLLGIPLPPGILG
ncbi:tripartite tricarboxylate transporter TctB family protein [Jiella sonneratiae]|uniref:Tripartite tricarboxylate transporter TctB family protein n=1 Tax=Jiella sonneratiae TaxID=2816856 RepID=A0ABS3J8B3_9HYPH|nr:tripartite tricarboxylate transporter TctB family protein [Jiella sonneratiae]